MKGGQVYICAEGIKADHAPTKGKNWPAKYHTTETCPALLSRSSRATRQMSQAKAEKLGWKRCKRCHM
jgi:hypothetical protein